MKEPMKPGLSLIALFLISACAKAPPAGPIAQDVEVVSLCDVVRNGREWNGRIARLRTIYLLEFHHGPILKDRACPDVALIPQDAPEAKGEVSIASFYNAIWSDTTPPGIASFEIEAVGRFSWRKRRFYLLRVIRYRQVESDFYK